MGFYFYSKKSLFNIASRVQSESNGRKNTEDLQSTELGICE
jgi:hypothetical protein